MLPLSSGGYPEEIVMRFAGPRNAGRPWSCVAFPPILNNRGGVREHEKASLDAVLEKSFPASDPVDPQKFN
jgi:hypothetical protein